MSGLVVTADDAGSDLGISDRVATRPTPEELCAGYSATVCRFASMMAASDSDAEDLAQEALLKAIRHLGRFDPAKGPVDRWLWRIVANTARDSRRAQVRRQSLWRRLTATWTEPSTTVEDRALESVSRHELLAAVRALKERDRMLIALRFGADLDLATVGHAIGLSGDSAGQAVLRALSRLRDRLEGVR